LPAALDKTLLIKTPKAENTTENPSTKNIVFRIIPVLLMVMTDPLLELSSVTVVPDMYARKAGIIGSIHGATNDAMPANRATSMVTSVINTVFDLCNKTDFPS
jgi:hypothetical protein